VSGRPGDFIVPLTSPNSASPSVRNLRSGYWNPLKPSQDEKIVKMVQGQEQVFKVLIVDRDSMTSDLLVLALSSDRRYEAVAVVGPRLMGVVSKGEVGLVIIGAELNSNGGNGLQLAETLYRAQPETKIIILLDDTSGESVLNAFRTGARGVFCRRQPMAEFLDCVEHVRKGFIWAGREETNHLLDAVKSIPKTNHLSDNDLPMLTARELEVVRYAARGKTNKTIASEMGLSEHTVKNYLFRAFAKIGVSSRVELLFHLANRANAFDVTMAEDRSADAVND
jgi:two-component system, NarL family, nitrate/nitrite response regulator NarL